MAPKRWLELVASVETPLTCDQTAARQEQSYTSATLSRRLRLLYFEIASFRQTPGSAPQDEQFLLFRRIGEFGRVRQTEIVRGLTHRHVGIAVVVTRADP